MPQGLDTVRNQYVSALHVVLLQTERHPFLRVRLALHPEHPNGFE